MTLPRSIERWWTERRFPPPRNGPRILVSGSCQAALMTQLMRLMRPDARVDYFAPDALARSGRAPAFGTRYDHVVVQPPPPRHPAATAFAALAERHPGFVAIPNLVFAAFHPDLIYVSGESDRRGFVSSPIGHYNSAIVLYAYLAGLTPSDAIRLFTEEVYAALGYLDLWSYSADTLLDLGRETGWDLAEPLQRWTRRGLFMHSTNHPRTFVLADLAADALTRAGLSACAADVEHYLAEDLAVQGAWPVYEPIARRYGVPASHLFLVQRLGAAQRHPPRALRLEDFVEGSFRAYAATPRERLHNDRVKTWLASDDIGRLLGGRSIEGTARSPAA